MTLSYKLRTLMILLAILPPLLAVGWTKYEAWREERERQRAMAEERARRDRLVIDFVWSLPQPNLPAIFRDSAGAAEPSVNLLPEEPRE